jgi:probable F420-dependent oxidoreductase
VELGRFGIWSGELRSSDSSAAASAAAELEDLGFGTLWLPGRGAGIFERVAEILAATRRVVVATGIVSIWQHQPEEVAAAFARIQYAHPGRFLLGLGISHGPLVDRDEPGRYSRPLERLRWFLDQLDSDANPVPVQSRVLASLGPRSLALAAQRSAGTHPYLVPPDHTTWARGLIGSGPLLAPEQAVALDADPAQARRRAGDHLAFYLTLPNYTNNLRRLGFTSEDLDGRGSDRLLDAIVAIGDAGLALERGRAHLDAGADHVCFQVIQERGSPPPLAHWRALTRASAAV